MLDPWVARQATGLLRRGDGGRVPCGCGHPGVGSRLRGVEGGPHSAAVPGCSRTCPLCSACVGARTRAFPAPGRGLQVQGRRPRGRPVLMAPRGPVV